MAASTRSERVDVVIRWLVPIAEPVAKEAEFSRWISARGTGDPDQSEDWCTSCASAEVERLNSTNPDHEYFVDGGWGSETDSAPYCCKCGKTLDDDLTRHAIEAEADHYSQNTVSLRGKQRAYRAFRFVQVFRSSDFDDKNPNMWKLFRKVERILLRGMRNGAESGCSLTMKTSP